MDKVSSNHVTWIDVENPTSDQLFDLSKKYMIHPLVTQELIVPTYRPKVETYDEHLYLVLHFPICDAERGICLSREIDFIIFPYNLITVHYEPIPQIDDFQKLLAEHGAFRERVFGFSSGHLLYQIINLMFTISRKELDGIEKRIIDIEEQVFTDLETIEEEALRNIAVVRRDLLNFQKALKPQEVILNTLSEHGKQFFGNTMTTQFNDIKASYFQVRNTVDHLWETLDTLYDTNISLLSANTNEIIKTLTLFTVILMPLSLLTFIYSMDIPWIPLRQSPYAFWALIGLMLLISGGMYQFFKQKRWL